MIIAHAIIECMQSDEGTVDRIVLVDKPAGMSSFGVVARVRGKLREEYGKKIKVGHTGTLDPFATGLLIILTGKMTKKSAEFLKLDKEYVATMRLGYTSTTGDPEGQITPYAISGQCASWADGRCTRREYVGRLAERTDEQQNGQENVGKFQGEKIPSSERIEEVAKSFVGRIEQTPPKYSAIKINGERAYKLARKGEDFEMPSREVEIYEIEVLRYNWPELEVRCKVSSGTYIRTLAVDIGTKLGVGAYLTELRRTRVGEDSVEDAVKL